MKKQYENQYLYEKTVKEDKLSSIQSMKPPKKVCTNSFNCNLKCNETPINLNMSADCKSISFTQYSKCNKHPCEK